MTYSKETIARAALEAGVGVEKIKEASRYVSRKELRDMYLGDG